MAKAVITDQGKEKLCKAHAGVQTLVKIVAMGVGNGGVNPDGSVIETTGKETTLKTLLLKKEVAAVTFPKPTTASYAMTLLPSELVHQRISEMGLFDAEGTLVCYKTFLPKDKDDDMEFTFEMQEIF